MQSIQQFHLKKGTLDFHILIFDLRCALEHRYTNLCIEIILLLLLLLFFYKSHKATESKKKTEKLLYVVYSPKIFQFDSVCSVVANHAHIFKDTIRLFLSPDVRFVVCLFLFSFFSFQSSQDFFNILTTYKWVICLYRATGHQSVFYRKVSMGYMTQRC